MIASIASRTHGRCRFNYEGVIKDSDVNKIKYKVEQLEGVKSCKVSPLANSIIVKYEEEYLPKVARFIMDLDLEELADLKSMMRTSCLKKKENSSIFCVTQCIEESSLHISYQCHLDQSEL